MDVGLVCDACSALTPIGVPHCKRCGEPVALDPRRAAMAAAPPVPPTIPPDDDEGQACTKCGVFVAAGTKFCPNCGTRVVIAPISFDVPTRVGPRPSAQHAAVQMPVAATKPVTAKGRSTLFFGAMQSARAKLTLIRGDGEDGVSFTLAGVDHLAGRGECPISFPDDTFLSPVHANFIYQNNQLSVRDENSLNGVYIRIQGKAELEAGATVLVGEQVLTVRPAPQPEDVPDDDGTYFSASIVRPATLEIRQNLRGGHAGWVYRPANDVVTLGREGNDINFPEDPFISGRHAELRLANGVLSVTDLGSRNGTFVRVNGERVLKHGDYVFLGQQLLRVEIV